MTDTPFDVLVSAIAKQVAAEIRKELVLTRPPDANGLDAIQPALLNIEQTAKYLGRTVKGVRDLERKGILTPVRFDRKVQFRRRDLDDAIERHAV